MFSIIGEVHRVGQSNRRCGRPICRQHINEHRAKRGCVAIRNDVYEARYTSKIQVWLVGHERKVERPIVGWGLPKELVCERKARRIISCHSESYAAVRFHCYPLQGDDWWRIWRTLPGAR